MKSKVFLALFALPFLGIGLWMLYSISSNMLDASRMQSWDTVPAQVITGGYNSNRGDDSTTYEAYGTFRYTYKGREYTSERVAISGGSDNIGDFQKDLGNRLSRAARNKKPIDAYVNPKNPSDAIISRDLRWPMIGFKMIFVIVFGGVGAGLLIYAIKSKAEPDSVPPEFADRPWMAKDAWSTNEIKSNAKLAMYVTWGFAVIWCSISAPLPFVLYKEVVEKQNYPALLGYLFPLAGIFIIVWAVRSTIQWRKFGQIPVVLNPFPGSIGGQTGGTIETKYPYDPANKFLMTLSNIYSYESGSGKERRRTEKLKWQDQAVAHTEMGLYGTRIVFRFDVPPELDQSDALHSGRDYYLWRLNVSADLPGVDLDQDYEIPVYPTAEKSTLTGRGLENAANATAEMATANAKLRFQIINGSSGQEFFYPFGRNLGAAFTALLAGGIFTAGGIFMMVHEHMYFFGGVFLLFGVPITLGGIYMATNSLHIFKDSSGGIVSLRRIFGIPVRRGYAFVDGMGTLETSSNFSTQSGNKHVKHYKIHGAGRDGRKITLGEGFHGEREAQAAIAIIRDTLGIYN